MRALTTTQAAQHLGLSRRTVLRMARQGAIAVAFRTAGGQYRFDPIAVDACARTARAVRTDRGLALEVGARAERAHETRERSNTRSVEAVGAIGGRQQAEAALGDNARRSRLLIEAMPIGVMVLGKDGRILSCNAAALSMFGLTEQQVLGKKPFEPGWGAVLEDGTPLARETLPFAVARDGGQAVGDVVVGVTRPVGDLVWVQGHAVPRYAPDGGIEAVICTFIDITARREGERALRFQAHLLDLVGQAVITIDVDGTIRYWNRCAETLIGWSAGEMLGSSVSPLFPRVSREEAARIKAELRTNRSWSGELDIQRRDGTIFPALVTDSPILDAAGAMIGIIIICIDITAWKQAEAVLRHQASHDSLTDLPNRAHLHECLDASLRQAEQNGEPVTLLLLDLDNFKEINDALGHHVGDRLLQQVARRLRHVLGAANTVARLGGDEFAMVVPGADTKAATAMAQRVVACLEAPCQIDGRALYVSASIGIALYPEHGSDVNKLLAHADVAMYEAKRARGGMAIYDQLYDQHSVRRLALLHDLRAAIREDGLRVFYQPKVGIPSMHLSGVEALLRWPHPVHGSIPPDEFIVLAEQTGLIVSLTEWVLLTVLRQARTWRDAGQPLPVAVNLSACSLQDPRFPDLVAGHLSRYNVPSRDLTLEITESSLMAEPARARDVLCRLHALGIRVAIDDFGTGYSSLAYLKELPVDEVKIDKSFVLGMATGDQKDATIVRAIIAMAHALGLKVVAEGVEDAVTCDLLAGLGCDLVQGYYLSRPVPAVELARWRHAWAATPTSGPVAAAVGSPL